MRLIHQVIHEFPELSQFIAAQLGRPGQQAFALQLDGPFEDSMSGLGQVDHQSPPSSVHRRCDDHRCLEGARGISIFVVDEPTPGFRKVRDIPVLARQWGIEEELVLEDVRVPRVGDG